MKKLFLLFSAFPFFAHAQDTTASQPCFKPWSVEIVGGMNSYSDIPFSNAEMQKVAPNSQLLQRDFSGYLASGNSPYNSFTINSSSYFSAMVEFVPYSKKKKDYKWYSTIRAGFSYSQIFIQGPSYWKDERQHLDTLYPGNGSTIYDDSVSHKSYNFQWVGQSIGIDVNQLFHTDEKRIFSIGMGYGVHLGMGLNTVFQAQYSNFNYLETTTVSPPSNYNSVESNFTSNAETENIRTKNVMVARFYFPLAMQIRFSRKENFWNKLAFTSETRASIDIQPVPGYGTLTRFYVNQNFGLKYYFVNNATVMRKGS